ncbi:MAG: hypothetical protein IT324_24895 [Anaerolineae bacterium]|nr:hypothetical protein [Anaerolineae bacterium]
MRIQRFVAQIMVIAVLWSLLLSALPVKAQSVSVTSDSATLNKPAWCNLALRRIQFRYGSYRGAVSGYLTPTCTQAFFVLRARAGQRMRLYLNSAGPVVGTVIFPNGGVRSLAVGTRGTFFDGILPFSGDYVVRVNQDMRIQLWFGYFGLSALIV